MPAQRALYFAVPKVACTTWLRICCRLQGVGLREVDGADWFDAIPHIGPDAVAGYPDWFRFGFVRNPWDRLVSCYLNKIRAADSPDIPTFRNGIPIAFERFGKFQAGMPFGEFARAVAGIPDAEADAHFRSQHTFFEHDGEPLRIDTIERFEDAPDSFRKVLDALDIESDELPHDKRTRGRRPYSSYYEDDETVSLVGERYATDIARYGYAFERAD